MEIEWLDDETFSIDGLEFVYSFDPSASSKRFAIRKPRALVEDTLRLASEFHGGRVVEMGIASGGSTAFLSVAGAPELLVALELDADPVASLEQLVVERSLEHVVRTHYGVDQGDRARLAAIVDKELQGEHIDLVIDDASHRYSETRTAFECLFPRLRPGGAYVIEDWSWQARLAFALSQRGRSKPAAGGEPTATPGRADAGGSGGSAGSARERLNEYVHDSWRTPALERLVIEIVLAAGCSEAVFGPVSIGTHQVVVRRGDADIDSDGFNLTDAYASGGGVIA